MIQVGDRYTRLTVISPGYSENYQRHWECRCDCGTVIFVLTANLGRGTKSCGCMSREYHAERLRTHGLGRPPGYATWAGMKGRCFNPRNRCYANYGGRGITVCERWLDFAAFYADMGPKPTPTSTIERVDNDGHYEPSNCVWVEKSEQSKNRRPASQWSRKRTSRPRST